MNKNQLHNEPDTDQPLQMSESWDGLLERIATLAHRRSQSLLAGQDDDDAFDRGARSLRTLMSAAEVALRLKRDEAKETENDDQGAAGHAFTEADIEAAYRKIYGVVERLESQDDDPRPGDHAQERKAPEEIAGGICGEAVAGERS